jgi:hypothetical protein
VLLKKGFHKRLKRQLRLTARMKRFIMNKFVAPLVLALVSCASVAQSKDDVAQCTAPSFGVGHEIPVVRQTFTGASAMGDISAATAGPTQWVERVTKMNGGEVEMVRTSPTSGQQYVSKLAAWPNEINIVSTNDIVWSGGTKDFLFPLTQGKEWSHSYYRQQGGNSQRINVKVKVTKVERVGDDTLCTVERKMDWDRSFGHHIYTVAVWSQLKGWGIHSKSYRTDTKEYIQTTYFGNQAN